MIKNQRNKDGNKHGLWEYYHYYNGKLWYKGNHKNGKRHGLWEFYYSNGNIMSKTNYINGKEYGYFESYHSNGNQTKQFHIWRIKKLKPK